MSYPKKITKTIRLDSDILRLIEIDAANKSLNLGQFFMELYAFSKCRDEDLAYFRRTQNLTIKGEK